MNRTVLMRKFHALLKESGTLANKEDILAGFGAESTADMTDAQLSDACNALERIKEQRNGSAELRRARSRVLYLCTDLNVWNGTDWDKLNKFMEQPRIAGKKLYELTLEELTELNKKLSAMVRKRKAAIEAESLKAKYN